MEQAINKAIEGGWKKYFYFSHFNTNEVALGDTRQDSENNPCFYIDKHQILLDPLFWKALGKEEGWKDDKKRAIYGGDYRFEWEHRWHRFIDHLASGEDIDSFFTNLIKSNDH